MLSKVHVPLFVVTVEVYIAVASDTEIAEKANIKQIRLHDFRHSCASLLVNNQAPITVVSSFMGHSNTTETLKTYSHLFKGKLNETMDIINNLSK